MKNIESIISKKIQATVRSNSVFSCKVAAIKKGRVVFDYKFGQDYLYYDLASMTKSIFTGLYFLESNVNKRLVSDVLPWLYDAPTRVGELLSHTSGLKAHKKHYTRLNKSEHKNTDLKKLLREDFHDLVKEMPLYSDLGYLVLSFVIKELEETQDLEGVFEDLKLKRKLSEGFHFNYKNKPKFKKSLYAPTENCSWRKKEIQGEVFDRNAWVMDGVSTHAGLFGSLSDMIGFYKVLKQSYSQSKFKTVAPGWTYGFMKPSGENSTAGAFFSKESIGHLGFTGSSFWFDPKVDFYITILSNRTYPDRNDTSFNSLRPWIHNLLYKEFVNEQPRPRQI